MKASKYTKSISKEYLEKLVNDKLSVNEICKLLNIPNRRVYDLFKYYNIEYTLNKGTFLQKNDTFFDNIDSEIKSYLLGFLIADGCILQEPKKKKGIIYSYNSRISFCNAIDDLEIIKLYNTHICPYNNIKFVNNQKGVKFRKLQCHLRWSSKYMVDRLINIGIKPRKTYDINFIFDFSILKSNDLIIHFLRGFFDGDGWASLNKSKTINVGFVGTSLPFLNQIIDFYKKYDLNFVVNKNTSKNMDYYQILLRGGKPASEKFKDIMYSNANFFLQRKYNKFINDNTEVTSEISKGSEAP